MQHFATDELLVEDYLREGAAVVQGDDSPAEAEGYTYVCVSK
jgi:hypothetical protein